MGVNYTSSLKVKKNRSIPKKSCTPLVKVCSKVVQIILKFIYLFIYLLPLLLLLAWDYELGGKVSNDVSFESTHQIHTNKCILLYTSTEGRFSKVVKRIVEFENVEFRNVRYLGTTGRGAKMPKI